MITTDTVDQVWLDDLHPNPLNPRGEIGPLDDLIASITAVGIIQPLTVADDGEGGWTILAGHRRHAALQAMCWTDPVPVHVVDARTAEQRTEIAIIENLQRVDLSPLDEARAFQALVDLGHSQRKIAERVGVSQGHVSKRLALNVLPDRARAMLTDGVMTIRHAEELARVDEADIDEVVALLDVGRCGQELRDWNIADAIRKLATQRKYAEAEKVGLASGKKRLATRPWDGAGGHRPCSKTDATHWYLGDGTTSIVWARTSKADAKARSAESGNVETEEGWQRDRRIREEVSAARSELLDALRPADRIAIGAEYIFAEFDDSERVTLEPISFGGDDDPLDVIAYAALENIRSVATQAPVEGQWDHDRQVRVMATWQRAADVVAGYDAPVESGVPVDDAAPLDDAAGITTAAVSICDAKGQLVATVEVPSRWAPTAYQQATATMLTSPPWSTYNLHPAKVVNTIAGIKSPLKLLHALIYEAHHEQRAEAIAAIAARLDELKGGAS